MAVTASDKVTEVPRLKDGVGESQTVASRGSNEVWSKGGGMEAFLALNARPTGGGENGTLNIPPIKTVTQKPETSMAAGVCAASPENMAFNDTKAAPAAAKPNPTPGATPDAGSKLSDHSKSTADNMITTAANTGRGTSQARRSVA